MVENIHCYSFLFFFSKKREEFTLSMLIRCLVGQLGDGIKHAQGGENVVVVYGVGWDGCVLYRIAEGGKT